MIRKGLFFIPVLLIFVLAQQPGYSQKSGTNPASAKPASTTTHTATANSAAAHSAPAPSGTQTRSGGSAANFATDSAASPMSGAGTAASENGAKSDCLTGPCDYQPPRITVANPPAIITPWLMRDKISWAASLVLALLGYVAIMMAVSLLYKIERQTRAVVASSEAALLHAQALQRAERPWVMVTVEPAVGRENSFVVVAVNRGRSAAQIEAAIDQAIMAADEEHLPATPQFPDKPAEKRSAPAILLPGESIELKRFSREDVTALCVTEERLKRVEDWEEKIYLYGKILYTDLTAVEGAPSHETGWCCWHIHGRQKSGLVPAGPAAYRVHS
jgi:hypothetical protein